MTKPQEASTVNGFARVKVAFGFTQSGYTWPERNELINLSKDVNPRLGEAKKQAALNAALKKRGISAAEYERIKQRAARPFYTVTDADDGTGEIVIPDRVFHSFLNHASQVVPKVIPRIEEKGLTFIGVKTTEGF